MIKFLRDRGFALDPSLFAECTPYSFIIQDNARDAVGHHEYQLRKYANLADTALAEMDRRQPGGIPELKYVDFLEWLQEQDFFSSGLELNDPFIDYNVASGKIFFGRKLVEAFEVTSSPAKPVAQVSRFASSPPATEPSTEVSREFYEETVVYL